MPQSPTIPARKPPRRHLAGELLRGALEIQWFKDRHGRGPTLIELARAMGLMSEQGAYYYVAVLKRRGIVRRALYGWIVVKPEVLRRRPTLLTCLGTIS